MKSNLFKSLQTCIFLLGILTIFSGNLFSAEKISISEAWIRWMPNQVPMSGGYAKLKNNSDSEIFITGVEFDSFKRTELHESLKIDGLMKMRKIGNISIKAGEEFELKPRHHHFMLIKPLKKFELGEKINFKVFLKDGTVVQSSAEFKKK